MLTNSGNPGKPIHPMSGTSSVIASYNESEEDQCCHFHMEWTEAKHMRLTQSFIAKQVLGSMGPL